MRMLTIERPQDFTPEMVGANALDVEAFEATADTEALLRVIEGEATALSGTENTLELSDEEVDEEFKAITEELAQDKSEVEPVENFGKWEGKKDWSGPRGAKK